MRRQVVALSIGVGLSVACALFSACGIGINGTDSTSDGGVDAANVDAMTIDGTAFDGAPDTSMHDSAADASLDASSDSAPPDSAPPDAAMDAAIDCGQMNFACGSACVSGCTACPGFTVQCNANRTCGSDCTTCPSQTIDCAYCPGGSPIQVCVTDPASCVVGTAACLCADGDAGDCPAANQVCIMMGPGPSFCATCGDPGTQGKTCGSAGECTMSSGTCQ